MSGYCTKGIRRGQRASLPDNTPVLTLQPLSIVCTGSYCSARLCFLKLHVSLIVGLAENLALESQSVCNNLGTD